MAMGDRPPEWTLAFRTLDIDVDPLPIAGAGGKGVDAILIDRDPAGRPELAADELRRARHGVLRHCHDRHLWQPAQIFAQDLAHVRLWQRVEEADLLRHLVRRQLAAAV